MFTKKKLPTVCRIPIFPGENFVRQIYVKQQQQKKVKSFV